MIDPSGVPEPNAPEKQASPGQSAPGSEADPSHLDSDRFLDIASHLGGLPPEEIELEMDRMVKAGEETEVLRRVRKALALSTLTKHGDVLQPDTVIGDDYIITDFIGRGGMGIVYEAVSKNTGRTVALKMMDPGVIVDAMRPRFCQEMRSLGRLDHPGIVTIYHAGQHTFPTGTKAEFFTMARIVGDRLSEYARSQKLSVEECLRLIRDAALATQYAHDRGVVHRDLKPGNIMVKPDKSIVILDFGLAAAITQAETDEAANHGLLPEGDSTMAPPAPGREGTPPYVAPEQAYGHSPTAAADVYSLGAILYELLAGQPLWRIPRTASLETIMGLASHPPARGSLTKLSSPPAIDDLLDKALALNPEDRFTSAASFARAINRLLPAHLASDPPHKWHPVAGAAVPATDWILENRLGDGAHGQVWLAVNRPASITTQNPAIPPPRVYKFSASEEAARTLRREYRVFRIFQAAANHRLAEPANELPGIVPIEAISLDDPPCYIAMRWIADSTDLETWMLNLATDISSPTKSGPASPPDSTANPASTSESTALAIVCGVADALQFAHDNGVLHRDIKPDNILIRPDASAPGGIRAWLMDFGLADIEESAWKSLLTRSYTGGKAAALVGAPDYIAPEIKRGTSATIRSDLYALGVVFYRLLLRDVRAPLLDWKDRITDPFLRDDLSRLLADIPDHRFPSAAALAESLRGLTERRSVAAQAAQAAAEAEARRQAELAVAQRTAYRKGVWRTTAIAAVVIASLGGLSILALRKAREAAKSRAEQALQRTLSLQSEAEGRSRGMELLEIAAGYPDSPAKLRTAAASMLDLTDFSAASPPSARVVEFPAVPHGERECCRTPNQSGDLLAIGNNLDGLNGSVDFVALGSGKRMTFARKDFPWIPVPDSHLLRFSPDGKKLVVGGKTSRHLLICASEFDDTSSANLLSYIHHGSDPTAVAWHPGGRVLASGTDDSSLLLWDLEAAATPTQAARDPDFDLPPFLTHPALDIPICRLSGHRSAIRALAFDAQGRWMASADTSGYLRIWSGFSPAGLPNLPNAAAAVSSQGLALTSPPTLVVERRLSTSQDILDLEFRDDFLVVLRPAGSEEAYRISAGTLSNRIYVAPLIHSMAWNGDGSQICVCTPTDIHWLQSEPLKKLYRAADKFPVAVAWHPYEDYWSVPKANEYAERKIIPGPAGWESKKGAEVEMEAGEDAARSGVAAAEDGRIAYYHDHQIHFARDGTLKLKDSLPVDCPDGSFKEILWDRAGERLTVVFSLPGGAMRLLSWSTNAAYPPDAKPLVPVNLEIHSAAPLNDGRHLLVRGKSLGLAKLELSSGSLSVIDDSDPLRQDGAIIACEDGSLVACVVDRSTVRIIKVSDQQPFSDLHKDTDSPILRLAWHAKRGRLAAATEDGFLHVWSLNSWFQWLDTHHLAE